ncbi:MAG: putative surface protein [Phormidesmis priestleyi Ana]|uniref:Putative surface protein n=1 Tax=Phormidesmis priestleyi Ana TaxID=1666911 RepID=A0A0P7ZGS8_9CYAN|nr:MAG: putative surface protein [Phormidesmis priestleyi Ana]
MFSSFLARSVAISTALASTGLLLLVTPANAETIAQPASNFLIADNHLDSEATGNEAAGNEAAGSEPVDGTMNNTAATDTATDTIVDVASNSESFSTLVTALESAGLASTLSEQGPYTVFAPTDEAFAELPAGALEFLLQPENEAILTEILTYHVVPGEIAANELSTGGIDALGGGIAIAVSDSGVVVNNGSVTQPNIQASNGIIHQINRVLIPTDIRQQLLASLGVTSLYE